MDMRIRQLETGCSEEPSQWRQLILSTSCHLTAKLCGRHLIRAFHCRVCMLKSCRMCSILGETLNKRAEGYQIAGTMVVVANHILVQPLQLVSI